MIAARTNPVPTHGEKLQRRDPYAVRHCSVSLTLRLSSNNLERARAELLHLAAILLSRLTKLAACLNATSQPCSTFSPVFGPCGGQWLWDYVVRQNREIIVQYSRLEMTLAIGFGRDQAALFAPWRPHNRWPHFTTHPLSAAASKCPS